MDPLAFGIAPYGCPARELELLRRRTALEDELRVAQEHQRRALRHTRRQTIIQQAQQIGALVSKLQDSMTRSSLQKEEQQPIDPALLRHSMLVKVMQRNEQQPQGALRRHPSATDHREQDVRAPVSRCEPKEPLKSEDAVRLATSTEAASDSPQSNKTKDSLRLEKTDQHIAATQSSVSPWSTLESLPEVEWTDNDEELLDKLLNGDTDGTHVLPLPGANPLSDTLNLEGDTNDDADLSAVTKQKKQQQEERLESRRKLTRLYEVASQTNTAGLRRPRWRIQQDIENGVVRPFVDESDTVSEQPMALQQVFRSAVIAVLSLIELQRLRREKQLREKNKSMQDMEALLNVYFDATRVWLGRLAQTPLLSILQDPTLDMDVSTKSGLFQASRGLHKWIGARQKSLSPSTVSPDTTASSGKSTATNANRLHAKLVKLKVRVKGVLDAIVKALERDDVPAGILEFWKRLTCDGVYFPDQYPLFPSERIALDLDALGATRGVASMASTPGGHSRFQIVLVNFVVVRILIPHVILTPWELGLGSSSSGSRVREQKSITKNLQNVATLLYVIASRLSPLPPICTREEFSLTARLGARRRSVEVAPTQQSNQTETQPELVAGQRRFISIEGLHELLIPERSFPADHLEPFINEQQRRLHDVLGLLQAKLHPVALPNECAIATE